MQPLHQRPSVDSNARAQHPLAIEQMLCRYVVFLVEVQKTVQHKQALNYAQCIRSVINDWVGYDIQSYHRHLNLTKMVDRLDTAHPHQARRRDPLLQQHLLAWSRRLNCELHSHRLGLAIAVTTWGNSCRWGDLGPRLLSLPEVPRSV